MRYAALLVLIFAFTFLAGCTVVLPNLSRAERSARETSAIKAITTIHTAQVQYFSIYGRFATSLQELGPPASGAEGPAAAGLIEHDLASGEKNGYKFAVQVTPAGYSVTATPSQYGVSGSRTFFSDQAMGIRQHMGLEPATVNDPLIGE